VSSLELGSVTIQARLGSARLLYKLDSARLGYCTSSARARLSSTRLGSFTGLGGRNHPQWWFRTTIEPKVPLRRLLQVRGFGGVRDSVRVGAAVVDADALHAGAGDPACLGQCDMALRAAVGAPGAALGGPHERPLHKPVWLPEAILS
jgi:hypothetical protein